jgi:hypothetical protein
METTNDAIRFLTEALENHQHTVSLLLEDDSNDNYGKGRASLKIKTSKPKADYSDDDLDLWELKTMDHEEKLDTVVKIVALLLQQQYEIAELLRGDN